MKRFFKKTYVKEGYTLVCIKENGAGETIALIDRNITFCSYVVAWKYDKNNGTWGQGHYFERLADAKRYFNTKY